MDIVPIPVDAISREVLDALMEEFVTRDGTDYGLEERTLARKKAAVLAQIHGGDAVIVFDPESESCNIVLERDINL